MDSVQPQNGVIPCYNLDLWLDCSSVLFLVKFRQNLQSILSPSHNPFKTHTLGSVVRDAKP